VIVDEGKSNVQNTTESKYSLSRHSGTNHLWAACARLLPDACLRGQSYNCVQPELAKNRENPLPNFKPMGTFPGTRPKKAWNAFDEGYLVNEDGWPSLGSLYCFTYVVSWWGIRRPMM
jgi:hypothetical protein